MTIRKIILIFVFVILYLVSTVPVGLFLYSLKSENNINVFSNTGFHSYASCLASESQKAIKEIKGGDTTPAAAQ